MIQGVKTLFQVVKQPPLSQFIQQPVGISFNATDAEILEYVVQRFAVSIALLLYIVMLRRCPDGISSYRSALTIHDLMHRTSSSNVGTASLGPRGQGGVYCSPPQLRISSSRRGSK
jgi:hypothetical protein